MDSIDTYQTIWTYIKFDTLINCSNSDHLSLNYDSTYLIATVAGVYLLQRNFTIINNGGSSATATIKMKTLKNGIEPWGGKWSDYYLTKTNGQYYTRGYCSKIILAAGDSIAMQYKTSNVDFDFVGDPEYDKVNSIGFGVSKLSSIKP